MDRTAFFAALRCAVARLAFSARLSASRRWTASTAFWMPSPLMEMDETSPDKMFDPVISARVMIKGLLGGRWNGAGKGIAIYLPTNGSDDLKVSANFGAPFEAQRSEA